MGSTRGLYGFSAGALLITIGLEVYYRVVKDHKGKLLLAMPTINIVGQRLQDWLYLRFEGRGFPNKGQGPRSDLTPGCL